MNLTLASQQKLRRNASCVTRAAAAGIRPDPEERVSDWAQSYRVVPDEGSRPGPWDNSVSPELVEIMDTLSPDDPCPHAVLEKCAQSGGSAVAENFIGYVMHRSPGPMMYIGPTVKGAKDWYEEKLKATIEASPVLNPMRGGVVAPHRSRSGDGSKSDRVKFKGGWMLLAGANSAATLRQHSIRFMVRDDRSAWTEDADGEGNPVKLSDQRLKTYRRFAMEKVLDVSSPKIKGEDIDADYEASDKRRYYMACKGCKQVTDWDWEDVQKAEHPPYRCKVVCPACGAEHTMSDRDAMKSPANGARWVPTVPDLETGEVPLKTLTTEEAERWRGRRTGRSSKGYALTGFMNTFDTWENLAKEEAEAGEDPALQQPFFNGTLGRAWEPKGEGPSWESMSARRESDWHRGTLPAGPLYVTLTVDVQATGLYWSYKGYGPNKQCWHLDYGFEAGLTDAPLEGAWPKLDLVAERGVRFGNVRIAADRIAVDTNYNTEAALRWVKRRANALAIKGEPGWNKPPIYRASNPEIKKSGVSMGRAKKHGMLVWHVGTYPIKGALAIYYARELKEGEGGGFPIGYQHYPADAEEAYFQQLASEYVAIEQKNGMPVRTWKPRGPNHWFDCDVYSWALTHYDGLWNWDDGRWAELASRLSEMTKFDQGDMFRPDRQPVAADPVQEKAADPAKGAVSISKSNSNDDAALDALAKLNQR